MKIYCGDCIDPDKRISDGSVKLGIFDPPFGIEETGFNKHYKRDSNNVIPGYKEAPDDYGQWTHLWLYEAKRVLHDDGSMYIISGHSNLRHVLNTIHDLGLHLINHIIWKYNFGVNTKRKFVTSHYHILYVCKNEKAKVTFNTNCRFGCQEIAEDGGKALYDDMEDVFVINKDFAPGEKKNQNKLPEELIKKLIQYSSNPGDMVCDFFMGNFTTATVARKLGRNVCGYELNEGSFNYHMERLRELKFGCDVGTLKKVENVIPKNQGKPISEEEIKHICEDYKKMLDDKMMKKVISQKLQEKYGRGKFAVKNILDKHIKQYE
jgi:site-specific DNA-methyltransferase (adenine-specific)